MKATKHNQKKRTAQIQERETETERDRDRDRDRERQRQRERESVCVCVEDSSAKKRNFHGEVYLVLTENQ